MYTGRTGLQCVASFIMQESAPIHLWRSSRNILSRFPRWYKEDTWGNQKPTPLLSGPPSPLKCTASKGGNPSNTASPIPKNVRLSLPVSRIPVAVAPEAVGDRPSRAPADGFFRVVCGPGVGPFISCAIRSVHTVSSSAMQRQY